MTAIEFNRGDLVRLRRVPLNHWFHKRMDTIFVVAIGGTTDWYKSTGEEEHDEMYDAYDQNVIEMEGGFAGFAWRFEKVPIAPKIDKEYEDLYT